MGEEGAAKEVAPFFACVVAQTIVLGDLRAVAKRMPTELKSTEMQTNSSAEQQAIERLVHRKLEAAGVRPTRQRMDLGCAIFGAGDRHFTAEMIYEETRSIRFAPTMGTIYNTLGEFARRGLLREIAVYDAKLCNDTKTGPHFHFYREDSDELWDVPDEWRPGIEIPVPEGMRIVTVDVIVRLKKL